MSGKELKREFFKLKLFTQSLAELKDPHTPEFLNVREEKEINRHMNLHQDFKKKREYERDGHQSSHLPY